MIGFISAAVAIGALAWMIGKFINIPMGYEDERGFHYGEPGDDQ